MPDVSKTDDASRLGLGAQISVLFAIGGLLVSVLLSAATLVLTRQQLLETRGSAAAAMAVSNATRLSNQLTPESSIEDLPTIVDSLTRIGGSQRIIRMGDDWLVAPELDRADLPTPLVTRLGDRRPGQMLAMVRGEPRYGVGERKRAVGGERGGCGWSVVDERCVWSVLCWIFFFQAEDGIRD